MKVKSKPIKGVYFAGSFLSGAIKGTRAIYEEIAERIEEKGWYIVTASSYKNRILRMFDFLWTAIRYHMQYQVASVAVFSDLAFRWAELLCFFLRVLNKPYVLTLHGGKLPEFAERNPRRVRELLEAATAVATPSKYLHHSFRSYRNDIIYVPNGIDNCDFNKKIIKNPKPSLVWLRAFHYIYQPQNAVEVIAQLKEEFPTINLIMIGPDKQDGYYERTKLAIETYSIEENVQLIDAIPKASVPEYLFKGDIFLNTTIYESFGVSVMEAAACGLCIVTTNAGELPLMWEDGVDALIVPTNDINAMASAVRRILIEPGLAEKLSINARKKAESYDWSEVLPLWENLFSQMIKGNRE